MTIQPARGKSGPVHVTRVKPADRGRAGLSRMTLLAGVSVMAMTLATSQPANARMLRGMSGATNATAIASDVAIQAQQQAAAAAAQSLSALQRATQAIQAMQSVQAAARAAAQNGANNLGLDPNHPGRLLPDVPNGLAPGGLVPDSGLAGSGVANPVNPDPKNPTWIGANRPTQTAANGQTTVDIQQTAPQALLTWQTFNVGKNTTVNFDQQSSSWVALNRINDPSGVPSQILGQIRASGSVLVINQNGIIFGGSSQINVHTLIASAIDLNDPASSGSAFPSYPNFLSGKGIFNDSPTFQDSAQDNSFLSSLPGRSVSVQAGAQLNGSGDVVLLAPKVQNDGVIATPSGQALLLGGSDATLGNADSYVRGFFVLPNSSAPNPNLPGDLNGQNVAGGFYSSVTPGSVVNNGWIDAPQGNITMVGGTINQNGVLTSTTATTGNGSIILRAENGTLLLGGAGDNPLYAQYGVGAQPSLLQIVPDAADSAQITDSQAIANSSISLTGVHVDLRGIVLLHGYDITNPTVPDGINDPAPGISIAATGNSSAGVTGQVLLESGSLLDASGATDATASASRNSVAVELRVNEIADSPLLQDPSSLYQKTIYVDASVSGTYADGTTWQGTPLANATGWISGIDRSLDERLMNGAPITIGGASLVSRGQSIGQNPVNFVQMPGSGINISGGYLTYTAGYVNVSTLVGADGRLYSASNANPNISYVGICCSFTVEHARWGQPEVFTSLLSKSGYQQPGYIQGGAGGSLTLNAQAAISGGAIESSVIDGEKQRSAAAAATPASLVINGVNVPAATDPALLFGTVYNADTIVVSDAAAKTASQWAAGFTVGADLNSLLTGNAADPNSLYISSAWLNSGFGNISLAANGKVMLAAGNPLNLPAGGSLSLSANTVDIQSSITAPGGTVTLAGSYTSASSFITNPNLSISGNSALVTIAAGVTISAAGAWTNDLNGAGALAPNGGTINISSYGDIDLGQGTMLDVSGGAYLSMAAKLTTGGGGALKLTAGLPLKLNAGAQSGSVPPVIEPTGSVHFANGVLAPDQLKGYGVNGAAGGSLSLTSYDVDTIVAPSVTGGALMVEGPTTADANGNAYSPLAISTDFFSSGGFSSISLTSAGISLPAGVILAPKVASLVVSNNHLAASQSSLSGLAATALLAQGIRPAASIALNAAGDLWNRGVTNPSAAYQSTVDLAHYGLDIAGVIETDPKGSVSLTGAQIAVVSGIVEAPGGSIALSGGTYSYISASINPLPLDGEGVWLTAGGQLLAPGTRIDIPQSNGLTYRDVLPGGQVTVSGGDVILAPGSVIDVSGAAGLATLNAAGADASAGSVPAHLLGNSLATATYPVASSAGTISISVVVGGVLEGELLARSGGTGAAGGTLSLSIATHPGGVGGPTGYWPHIENTFIVLQQTLQPGDKYYVDGAALRPGNNPANAPANDAVLPIAATTFSQGGFASLILNGFDPPQASGGGSSVFVTFQGDTTFNVPGQFVLQNLGTIMVPNGVTGTVNAGYALWNNATGFVSGAPLGSIVSTGNVDYGPNQGVNLPGTIQNLVVQQPMDGLFYAGEHLTLVDSDNGGKGTDNNMTATVASYDPATGALAITVDTVTGTGSTINWSVTPLGGTGVLALNAKTMDIVGSAAVQNTQRAVFNIAGDLRLNGTSATLAGSLAAYQELDLAAGQIYPSTDTTFTLASASKIVITANGAPPQAPLSAGGTLNVYAPEIDQSGTLRAPTGSITLGSNAAQTIDGMSVASTDTLNLGAGSLTSVSADGLTTLYGNVDNGTDWYYNPFPGIPTTPITAPPVKLVNLNGRNISSAASAVIDESGGGDLFAGEFVQGTGGSKNIFAGSNQNFAPGAQVYAVIPSYGGITTPYDPSISTSGPSAGKQVYLSGIPGLPPGFYTLLPPQYAELPGAFLLTVKASPGASTVPSTQNPASPFAQADGSWLISGYYKTPGTGATDEHWSTFQVMSSDVARRYTEIDNYTANQFFTDQANANGTAIPRLPQDAGQLSIASTGQLNFKGIGVFDHPNGLGGLADISANQIVVVDSPVAAGISDGSVSAANYMPGGSSVTLGDDYAFNGHTSTSPTSLVIQTGATQLIATQPGLGIVNGQTITVTDSTDSRNNMTGTVQAYDSVTGVLVVNVTTANKVGTGNVVKSSWTISVGATDTWKPVVLAAGDLARLGVESLLLGGSRSFQADGVHVTAIATNVVIANDAAEPLSLPDIQIVARPEEASNSVIVGSTVSAAWTVAKTVEGTGQVIVAPNAVIKASGPVAPGEASVYWMSASDLKPVPNGGANGYSSADLQTYYQAVADNQVGYLRVSGGNLVTINRGNANYNGLPPVSVDTSGTAINSWGSGWLAGSTTITLTTTGNITNGQSVLVTGSNGQRLSGLVTAVNGNVITVRIIQTVGSGASTSEKITTLNSASGNSGLPSATTSPSFALNGSVIIGSGAQLTSSNSVTVFASGSSTFDFGADGTAGPVISAQAAEFKGSQINLMGAGVAGTPSGLVLDQAMLDSLKGVKMVELVSAETIDIYGNVSLGQTDPSTGQPILGELILDSAGLIQKSSSGGATFTAEQVVLQNSVGGTVSQPVARNGSTSLVINAADVLGVDPNGQATGYNNAQIALGGGNFVIAGFGNADLKSTGQIVATGAFQNGGQIVSTGNDGNLNVQSSLTLDAPRIATGIMITDPTTGLPKFDTVNYTITAADNPASPATYYTVDMTNVSGAAPVLPILQLGGSLSVTGGQININTSVVMPGGSFTATANGAGNGISVGPQGIVDVSGQAIHFSDVVATIGGGNITLSAASGGIDIQAGSVLNVSSDFADVGAINQTSAGTISLSAAAGGVRIADGTLRGQGPTVDSGGSFILDSATLDGRTIGGTTFSNYDSIAAVLNAGDFTKSWNIRARNGDIAMSGLSRARNITVSADGGTTASPDGGDIDITGTIDASGATPGIINIWAGKDLNLRSTAFLNAHGLTADANGKGGQVLLVASQAGDQQGFLNLETGARIDVTADVQNAGVSGPVLGGQVTFIASRDAAGTGVMLNVHGGNFASFLNGVKGESAWDGIAVVGNRIYSYDDTTLTVTPGTTVARNSSTGTETVSFQTYIDDANIFMGVNGSTGGDGATVWGALNNSDDPAGVSGIDANGVATTTNANAVISSGLSSNATGQVLVNIRPGIAIRNTGAITIAGDAKNENGIDLSGSSYGTSVLNHGDSQSLNGHFGQYDQPIVLAIRAAGNLNFGTYSSNGILSLGSLGDGFTQYYTDANGQQQLLYGSELSGAGASGAATLFDPAAVGAYSGRSGGLGADSATYFLTAGADLAAANPLAVDPKSSGTLTVAGVPGEATKTVSTSKGQSAETADPLYLYNYDTNGGSSSLTLANYTDYASLVRTGTGSIDIATSKDLVLQSPLSLIYTAGVGYNVGYNDGSGTADQPLPGFTQYNGMLSITGARAADTLPASAFPAHGGDLRLTVGGNITGDMNANVTLVSGSGAGAFAGSDQELPYDMTALGSQLKLQNWDPNTGGTVATAQINGGAFALMGGFSSLYATDAWMQSDINSSANKKTYYTLGGVAPTLATPGNYQLAWYTWFPFLENTIGSFGGGNISVRAGGNISKVQFVSPTNARDAGPMLVGTSYNAAAQTGLYVQGGGNVSVEAGGDVGGVYTYVQNGKTLLKAGGSIGCSPSCTSVTFGLDPNIHTIVESATGDVTLIAGGTISLTSPTLYPDVLATSNKGAMTAPAFSLIQNASILNDLTPPDLRDTSWARQGSVLTGLLTSAPTGTLSLMALGSVTLDVPGTPSWNTSQGILPPQVNLISLNNDVVNNGNFITYPSQDGTVNMLARGSVVLNQGFVISDAWPTVMPTIANVAAVLAPYNQTVTLDNGDAATLLPQYSQIGQNGSQTYAVRQFGWGGANYLPGQNPDYFGPSSVVSGDQPAQLIRDPSVAAFASSSPYGAAYQGTDPQTEFNRHAGLHTDSNDPARIIALTGDVSQGGATERTASQLPAPSFASSYENITKATQVYAGRDIINLALIGQHTNQDDVTSITAGRDVIWPLSTANIYTIPLAVEVGGPGNLIVMSGRNVDLGSSAGIQTIGNVLDPNMPGQGAGVTIETGLGSLLTQPNYGVFAAQFVDPASTSPYAEPLQLYDSNGNLIGGSASVYTYLQDPALSPTQRSVLLNRIFFDLVRDSGREHEGAAGGGNYESGFGANTVDTAGVLNSGDSNYQRAYAAIDTFFANISPKPYSHGDFLGGLSSVRTQGGGNITILSPNGQIQVGLAAPPSVFTALGGYAVPKDPLWALNFGIATEKGGDVNLYADNDISVDQSRIFTLQGGDITIVSRTGNIDAGKGAKTVQSVQPPNVSYDPYGNITITPYGPASGSGIATLRTLPWVPHGNADLIAFIGSINAGDAGIRVSGNINLSALVVLNADNIQVQGTSTGVPTVQAPPIAALTSASNTTGAARPAGPETTASTDQPSVIIVEFLGFGGGDGNGVSTQPQDDKKRGNSNDDRRSYDMNSRLQVIGLGTLTDDQKRQLTESEQRKLIGQ